MTATGHAIIGTIIAIKVGDPRLAIPVALTSHILADLVPHWDTATNAKLKTKKLTIFQTGIDVAVGFILASLILMVFSPKTSFLYAFPIIIASQFFDWITALYYFFNIRSFKWMYDFQKLFDNRLDKPFGIIYQIAFIAFIALIALFF